MRLLNSLILAGLLAILAGCNTVGGMGEDLQSGGQAITGTAQDVENDM